MRLVLILIFFLIFTPATISASTIFPNVDGDMHLTKAESPYVVNGTVTIASGSSLTIDPGVCIKILPAGSILMQGNVKAIGTQDEPIIFTSIKNDSACGDTNDDGDLSSPQKADWSGIVSSGNSVFQNVEISYADIGLLVDGGDLSILSSSIKNNQDRGVSVQNSIAVEIVNTNFSNNRYPIDIPISTHFLHSGNSADANQINAIAINGDMAGVKTLTKDSIPYFVNSLNIASGTVLNINPGVCIKMLPIAIIYIQGVLNVYGTKNDSVYFTSIKDDSVCGDTNNDSSSTVPSYGDWSRVQINSGGVLNANYLITKYGGAQANDNFYANILNNGGAILLNNSSSTNAFSFGFRQISGTSTVFSTGFGNQTTGIEIDGGSMTINRSSFENNFGSAVDTSNITDASTTVIATKNWWGSVDGPRHFPEKVDGTGQWINGDHIDFSEWLGGDPKTWVIDPVVVVPGILGSWKDWHGDWKLDPITHTYDNLVNTLKANGYTEGQNLFLFPYDWEKTIEDTAVLLKQKIADVKTACGCTKVDLVAHSMGGLVARQYIQSADYQNDVDQMIFIATPHLGSVFAYLADEGGDIGDTKDDNTLETAIRYIGLKRYGYLNLNDYMHDKVLSMKELLPITNYLKDQNGQLMSYPTGYPRNAFLKNLDSNISLVSQRVRSIRNFVGDIGTTSTKTILTIASSTESSKWRDGEPVNIEYGNGDNRVSTTSAQRIGGTTTVHNFEHGDLVTGVEFDIVKELTLDNPSSTANSSRSKNVLLLLVNSPVDITVTSPNGQTYGMGGANNDSDNAFYTNSGDEEFLVINDPEEGNYQITSTGTGGGSYSIDAHFITDNGDSQTSFSGNTQIGQTNTQAINISNNSVQIVSQNNQVVINDNKILPPHIQSTVSTDVATTATTTISVPSKKKTTNSRHIVEKPFIKVPVQNQEPPKQIPLRNSASVYTGWELIKKLIKFILRN